MKKTKISKSDSRNVSKFKQWVENIINEIINDGLLIDFMDIEVAYIDKALNNHPDCVFSMNYNNKYRMGALSVYPIAYDLFEKGKINELISGLTHELAHIHTIPVAELAMNRFTSEKELNNVFEELTQIIAEYIKRSR